MYIYLIDPVKCFLRHLYIYLYIYKCVHRNRNNTNEGVTLHSKDITQAQQQRPGSPTVTYLYTLHVRYTGVYRHKTEPIFIEHQTLTLKLAQYKHTNTHIYMLASE